MRRTTIIGLHRNRNRWAEALRRNQALIWLAALFLLGLLAGVLALGASDEGSAADAAGQSLRAYLAARNGRSFFFILLRSLISQLPFLLLAFLCGTSVAGVALAPLLVAYRGFSLGLLTALLYAAYSLKGISFCVLILLPVALLSVIALLLAARESIGFSLLLARLCMPNAPGESVYADFRNYCARYLFLFFFFLAAAVSDAALSRLFLRFFAF